MSTSIQQNLETARRPARQMRVVAILAAVVANVIILLVGKIIDGDYPVATVQNDDESIKFAQVIVATLLAGLVAWGLLALLERTSARAATIWTAIAVIVLLISLLGPLGSGVNTYSKVLLTGMHLAAAAAIVPLMRNTATNRA